jgi:hypothetical protein
MASATRDAATTDAVPINRLRAPAGSSDQGTGDSCRVRQWSVRRSTRSKGGANRLPLDARVSTIETVGYFWAVLRVSRTSRRYRVGRERTASLTAWTMMSKSYGLPITS